MAFAVQPIGPGEYTFACDNCSESWGFDNWAAGTALIGFNIFAVWPLLR